MRTQIGKWGNSLAVRIPDIFVKDLHLAKGMELEICLREGSIVLRPPAREYSLEELVAGITPENRHDEIDWGEAVGV